MTSTSTHKRHSRPSQRSLPGSLSQSHHSILSSAFSTDPIPLESYMVLCRSATGQNSISLFFKGDEVTLVAKLDTAAQLSENQHRAIASVTQELSERIASWYLDHELGGVILRTVNAQQDTLSFFISPTNVKPWDPQHYLPMLKRDMSAITHCLRIQDTMQRLLTQWLGTEVYVNMMQTTTEQWWKKHGTGDNVKPGQLPKELFHEVLEKLAAQLTFDVVVSEANITLSGRDYTRLQSLLSRHSIDLAAFDERDVHNDRRSNSTSPPESDLQTLALTCSSTALYKTIEQRALEYRQNPPTEKAQSAPATTSSRTRKLAMATRDMITCSKCSKISFQMLTCDCGAMNTCMTCAGANREHFKAKGFQCGPQCR